MSSSSRPLWMSIHVILSAFFLPVAIMFAITGALYTNGQKGGYETDKVELTLDAPLTGEQDQLMEIARAELASRDLDQPSGKPKVRRVGTSYQLEWSGSRMDVILAPTADPAKASLQMKRTDTHRFFVQLHKAKGGQLFKNLAMALGAGLLLIFASGVILAWSIPKLRKQTLVSVAAGAVGFGLIAFLS